jgi:hypothetical protein
VTLIEKLTWVQDVEGDGWTDEQYGWCQVWPDGHGGWTWQITITEQYISGPYPGTPDWNEYDIGSGDEKTLLEAKWKAMRCLDRACLKQSILDDEMEQQMYESYLEQERWGG